MKKLMLLGLLAGTMTMMGCTKDKQKQSQLTIQLTDAPFNASEVNVEILQVRVNFSDDDNGWVDLDTQAGIYNLLELQNGVTKPLAQGDVPTGMLKEVRFVLGTQNSIKIGDETFPLTVPSGAESGLKIKVNKQLNATLESLVVDFDAGLSIKQTGTDDYKLIPVLKVK